MQCRYWRISTQDRHLSAVSCLSGCSAFFGCSHICFPCLLHGFEFCLNTVICSLSSLCNLCCLCIICCLCSLLAAFAAFAASAASAGSAASAAFAASAVFAASAASQHCPFLPCRLQTCSSAGPIHVCALLHVCMHMYKHTTYVHIPGVQDHWPPVRGVEIQDRWTDPDGYLLIP